MQFFNHRKKMEEILQLSLVGLLTLGLCVTGVGCDILGEENGNTSSTKGEIFTSPNAERFGRFGQSVAAIGDVDGGGMNDLVIGAPEETVNGSSEAGRGYLFSTEGDSLLRTVQSPTTKENARFGSTIVRVKDVNGDKMEDFIVGAPRESVSGRDAAGRVYLFSGADGRLIHRLESPDPEKYGEFGRAVGCAGDSNGDSVPDILVGAKFEDVGEISDAGRVYLFDGRSGSLLDTLDSPNREDSRLFGAAVSGIGDIDEDGTDDLVIGASNSDTDEVDGAGRVYLFSGADARALRVIESPNPTADGLFGNAIEAVGDVNNDGTEEVVIGARRETIKGTRAGRAYLYSAADGALLQVFEPPVSEERAFFGSTVGGGDVDGDGTSEIFVGAPFLTVRGKGNAGQGYLFSGADGSLRRVLEAPNAQGLAQFGSAIGWIDDGGKGKYVAIGAPDTDTGLISAGEVHLFGDLESAGN